jgi:hypothetical protein
MSESGFINGLNAYLKLCITLISGLIRISVQLIVLIPRVFSKCLNVAIKLAAIYKLAIDPALRSFGSFLAGLWRALMEKRASRSQTK